MLIPIHHSNFEKLTWTQRHDPISVSICSNVEGFTDPHCIVEPEVETLVRLMGEYMSRIGDKRYQLAQDKFADAFSQLDKDIQNPMRSLLEDDFEDVYKLDAFLDDEELQDHVEKEKNIFKKLDAYCRQTVVLRFNSAKYDMNLVKSHLAKQLGMHGSGKKITLKRNNSYACLANESFKFLDVASYLAPGVCYAKFLKAFDVSENKGFFPYEWFDGVGKLNHPTLPSHDAFYSSLKESNISAEDYAFWRVKNMSSFQDFLDWCNNLDVGPFVQAVENLQKCYFDSDIDIFKSSISVPGLARRMLFDTGRQAGASFALFDEVNSDLYHTIKQNSTGGPSITF
ncbi:unnamed protein product [Mytilus coruscus]|uniref:DNA-directed DNA polymerase n=1 Tax=Mytilus coruscus TaxID=42192 RepID=A0A6J8CWH9_MYTCO|nr:unnamed protein product [Mytilus coruscus]